MSATETAMTGAPLVLREDAGGVCTLTLNRPDKLNAISPALFDELRAHLEALAADGGELGVVLLRGAGKSFCAGVDLAGAGAVDLAVLRRQSRALEIFSQLPQIVIAAVHGHCFTGGLELALAADWIVAAESARFGDTHGKFGLVPAWGMTQRLPRRIGVAKALELMTTSRRLDGREAERIGLANSCVADAELDGAVAALAGAVLANSRHSNAANKRLVLDADGLSLAQGLAHEQFRSPGSKLRTPPA
ncbi:MAG TPA: enoyl-CoA hydratase/isomerase family protein [Burkholderiaceae bacterium]|jgi:enoyl-CoA hydratase/carnithine racemase